MAFFFHPRCRKRVPQLERRSAMRRRYNNRRWFRCWRSYCRGRSLCIPLSESKLIFLIKSRTTWSFRYLLQTRQSRRFYRFGTPFRFSSLQTCEKLTAHSADSRLFCASTSSPRHDRHGGTTPSLSSVQTQVVASFRALFGPVCLRLAIHPDVLTRPCSNLYDLLMCYLLPFHGLNSSRMPSQASGLCV